MRTIRFESIRLEILPASFVSLCHRRKKKLYKKTTNNNDILLSDLNFSNVKTDRYINYRKKIPADYYKNFDKELEDFRRSYNFPASLYSNRLLIPIPSDMLYKEILRRNDNSALQLNEELDVTLTLKYIFRLLIRI